GAQEVVAIEEILRRAVEADLTLLHAVRVLHEIERDVDRLLDQHNGGSAVVDAPDHVQQLRDDDRRDAERQLVDQQQAWLENEGLAQAEHLLLTTGQRARLLVAPLSEHGERLEALVDLSVETLPH